MKHTKLTYHTSGVTYGVLDALKRKAQREARKTTENLPLAIHKEIPASRGESAYVWEEKDCYRAFVIEGLGTKNLVADETRKLTGKTYYDAIAQDTVAMIVNDLIVVGATPQVINAYFAVGSSDWFSDEKRTTDLVKGWARACKRAGAIWGGGETPTLKGVIEPNTIDLAGSAIGVVTPKKRLVLGDKLVTGDAIVLVESSGIHANGLTLVRAIAKKLPKGYGTKLPSGKLFGEAILTPTHIYAAFVRDLFRCGVDIHYMVNITGHGFRKLMRANPNFTYRITAMPKVPEEFALIQKANHISNREMYQTFNMGAGFAVFVPAKETRAVQATAQTHGFNAWVGGEVVRGIKQVQIVPMKVTYNKSSLQLRVGY